MPNITTNYAIAYTNYIVSIAELSLARSTMAKKIWLSMNPRNFVSDKIVRTYERPPIHVRRCEMPYLLAGSFRHILSVFNLILDTHVT